LQFVFFCIEILGIENTPDEHYIALIIESFARKRLQPTLPKSEVRENSGTSLSIVLLYSMVQKNAFRASLYSYISSMVQKNAQRILIQRRRAVRLYMFTTFKKKSILFVFLHALRGSKKTRNVS